MAPENQEDTSLAKTDLPNPDLNPLMNPTLGRNLGRWAQVYFTSPPEKREEAVVELLRELQAQSGKPAPEPTVDPAGKVESAEGDSVLCAECGYHNPRPQRFCGMCGTRLGFDAENAPTAPNTPANGKREPFSNAPSSVPETVMPSFSAVADHTPSDISWLRQRNRAYEEPSGSGGSAKYLVIIAALVLLGALFYTRNRTQEASQASSLPATTAHNAPTPQGQLSSGTWVSATQTEPSIKEIEPAPTTKATESSVVPESPSFTVDDAAAKKHGSQLNGTPRPIQPVKAGTAVAAANIHAETVPDAIGGSTELAIAENYLTGKNGRRNSELAARLLWRAVAKENTTAILILSDLYLAGDGVPKSCAQARLLLRAASRKNVPGAATKLHSLQVSGCP